MTAAESKMDDSQHKMQKKLVPPDGGFGWVVTFAAAFILVFNQSLMSGFSLIYSGEIERLGHGTKGSALVANMMFLVLNFSGPLSGHLIKTFSARKVAMLGSMLSGFGVMISSLSTSLWQMIITYSLFTGLGMAMIQSSTFVAVNAYFTKKRGRAVGLSLSGAGLGQVIMPHIIRILQENYGFRGATLVIGSLCLNGMVGSLFLQPVEWHMKIENEVVPEKKHLLAKNKENDKKSEAINSDDGTKATKKITVTLKKDGLTTQAMVHSDDEFDLPKKKVSKLKSFVSNLDLNLLKSVRFVTVSIGCALAHSSMINFGILYPLFLLEKANLSLSSTAYAMSVLSGADIIGRITIPMITDRFKISATVGIMIGCLFMAVTRQTMAYQMSYTPIIILSALVGLGKTFIVVNQNIAISDQCRPDQVPSAVGLYMMTKGIIVLPAGLLMGWVRDYTGSFILSVSVVNVMAMVVVSLLLPQFIYSKICERNGKVKPVEH